MKDICLLVLTCDKYSDLWDSFTELFNRNWPDCPYDKYILTNEKQYHYYGFNSIPIGEDITWSYNLIKVLKILENKYKYIYITLEDTPIIEKVDNQYFQRIINSFIKIDGNFLRLLNAVKYPITRYNNFFGEIINFTPYRQSSACCVWKISLLLELLNEDESAWEFEKVGIIRGFKYDNFYNVYQSPFKILNIVIKGKLHKSSYKILQKHLPNIEIKRPFLSFFENLKLRITFFQLIIFFRLVPAKYQWKIYRFINK